MQDKAPGCRLSWITLAALGHVGSEQVRPQDGVPAVLATAETLAPAVATPRPRRVGCRWCARLEMAPPMSTTAAYATADVGLPHTAHTQFLATSHLAAEPLQPGDLVFYGIR